MATYVLPDMPYDYAALEPAITGEILELHHSKHHAAYVKGANDTLDRLAEARDKGDFSGLVGLEKTFAFNLSGHVLHSIFWENLSPDGGDRPDGELAAAIDEHFGSFEAFSKQLSTATASVQGSGWGVLAWEPLSQRLVVEQVYDHHGNVGMNTTPLLVFDAWEHAYYLQYRNVRPDYVEKLWYLVNWTDVTRRFTRFAASRSWQLDAPTSSELPPSECPRAGTLARGHFPAGVTRIFPKVTALPYQVVIGRFQRVATCARQAIPGRLSPHQPGPRSRTPADRAPRRAARRRAVLPLRSGVPSASGKPWEQVTC